MDDTKLFLDNFLQNQLGDVAMAGYSPLIPPSLRDKYKREADIDRYLKNIERLRQRGLV
tara:strand:+ start:227 stop:403 length:177 start_codon:yes stop_codon:yes gene_type:complete